MSGSAEPELPRGSSWDLIARNERLPEHLPRVLEAHIAYRAMKGVLACAVHAPGASEWFVVFLSDDPDVASAVALL